MFILEKGDKGGLEGRVLVCGTYNSANAEECYFYYFTNSAEDFCEKIGLMPRKEDRVALTDSFRAVIKALGANEKEFARRHFNFYVCPIDLCEGEADYYDSDVIAVGSYQTEELCRQGIYRAFEDYLARFWGQQEYKDCSEEAGPEHHNAHNTRGHMKQQQEGSDEKIFREFNPDRDRLEDFLSTYFIQPMLNHHGIRLKDYISVKGQMSRFILFLEHRHSKNGLLRPTARKIYNSIEGYGGSNRADLVSLYLQMMDAIFRESYQEAGEIKNRIAMILNPAQKPMAPKIPNL